MTARQITLAATGGVVLCASLYLYVSVRAAPAQPSQTAIAAGPAVAPVPVPAAHATDPWDPGTGSPQARAEAARTQLVGAPDTRREPPPTAPPPTAVEPTLTIDNSNVDEDLKAADGVTLANKLFDRGDYDESMKQALKILETDPKNVKMLRVVVSAACFMGDPDRAQKYWGQLTDDRDKAQMSVRCGRYGITFKQ